MSSAAAAPGADVARPGASVDPFVLPSDTDFRFVLLVATILGVTLYVYNVLSFTFTAGGMGALGVYARCDAVAVATAQRLSAAVTAVRGDVNPFDVAAFRSGAATRCVGPAQDRAVAWMVSGVAAVVAVAGVRYWTWPAVRQRRDHLVPLAAADAPEVTATLTSLCADVGLRPPPVFLWNPLDPSTGGTAFGRLGRHIVALGGGLVTQCFTDPAAFRAVLLHELAHLRNGDVDRTYFALSIWDAFVAVALVPYVLSLIGQPLEWAIAVTWRIAALAGLVYLTRNALLRTRELYADARVLQWEGSGNALDRVLAGIPTPSGRWARVAWLQDHPQSVERVRALCEPVRLFHIGATDAIATGIATTMAAPHLVTLLTSAGAGGASVVGPRVTALSVYSPLAAGVLALLAWRSALIETWASASRPGSAGRGLVTAALALASGFIAGHILSFDAVVQAPPAGSEAASLARGVLAALVIAAAACGTVALLYWLALTARRWLPPGAPRSRRATLPAFVASVLVASAGLAVWLGVLSATQQVGEVLAPRPTPAGVAESVADALTGAAGFVATAPLAGLAAVGLLAVPGAASLAKR